MTVASKSTRLSFDERETRILDAARRLFSERGFRGTTTKDIAKAANINEALIFRHYKSKEALYTGALQHVLSGKVERFLPELKNIEKLPLKTALVKLAKLIVSENRRHPELMRMLLFSALESHRLAKKFLSQSLPLLEWLESFFAAKHKSGEISRGDSDFLARMFMNLNLQYVLNVEIVGASRFYKKPESEVLKSFVEIFVDGVAT